MLELVGPTQNQEQPGPNTYRHEEAVPPRIDRSVLVLVQDTYCREVSDLDTHTKSEIRTRTTMMELIPTSATRSRVRTLTGKFVYVHLRGVR